MVEGGGLCLFFKGTAAHRNFTSFPPGRLSVLSVVKILGLESFGFFGFWGPGPLFGLKIEQFQELAVYLGVEPKSPQQWSFWIPLSCLFPVRSAPLSNGMRVSENHPRKTHAFWSKLGSRTPDPRKM